MSRYFRLHVPERQLGNHTVTGGYDLIFDRDHLEFVLIRSDGAAYVKVAGGENVEIVYKDEADRIIEWMECEE